MSQAARNAAQATGELPHEFLLRVMRGEDVFPDRSKDGTRWVPRLPTLAERLEAARAAAPYFAPRLAATDLHHEGALDAMRLEDHVSPEQMERIAREILIRRGYEFDDEPDRYNASRT